MTSETAPIKSVAARPEALRNAIPGVLKRTKDFLVNAVVQVRIYDKPLVGVMHSLIFLGVTIQVVGTAINLMQMDLFIPFIELPFPRSSSYLAYELVMDLAGVAILVGVTMAAIRRGVIRPKALETRWDDYYALGLLALIPIAGFTLESMRLLSAAPQWAAWSPIGNALASFWRSLGVTPEGAMELHPYLLVTHAFLGLLLLASIPFTKLRHLVATPLNIIFHPRRKNGSLEKIEDIEETEILGIGNVTEFTSERLLSFDACLRCGRCEEVCPATISGMVYSPRNLIQSLRTEMVNSLVTPSKNGGSEPGQLDEILPEYDSWSCTTCGACLDACPAFISPVDDVIDLRRYQTLTTGKIPKSVADTLRNMERQGNPWGMPAEARVAWAEGLNIREVMPGDETDVLLFVGCASAYDERNKKVARSFARLLQKAGVDFAILGLDEACCGETARRLGHEYLFQVYAEQNIEIFSQVRFNRIVTQCPHCFNTLKNEYPQMDGDFVVQHYTEYLAELSLPWETISPNGDGLQGLVSYHDSCYLGRYNQVYTQPRSLLDKSRVSTVEMPRNLADSFCCGGGGGQMWLETDAETRINQQRLNDALQVQADIVATACPYCLIMFDDAISSKGIGEDIQILDIAEILDKQLS